MSINIPCKFQEHWKQGRLLNRVSKRSNFSPRFEFTSDRLHYSLALFSSFICTRTTSKKDKFAFKRTLDYFRKKFPEYANNWLVSWVAVKVETVNVTCVSPSLERDFFPLLLFSRIAAFLFLDSAETLSLTASHSIIAWHSVRNITSFLYPVISISRRFFRKVTEGPFWCKFCFLLVVHVQMKLENNANK